jgi:hypothetical protein
VLDVGTFFYSKLSTNSALLALLGTTGNIVSSYPATIETFPLVIFHEQEQREVEFVDDKPTASESTFVIDIYVKDDTPTPIAQAICNIFLPIYWANTYNADTPDPTTTARHRVLRFYRGPIYASDLV